MSKNVIWRTTHCQRQKNHIFAEKSADMNLLVRIIIVSILFGIPCVVSAAQPDSTTVEKRRGGKIVVAATASAALNAAFTETLKSAVHEIRPDRTSHNSFPSRHTSWAFTASSVVSRECYRYSPWWGTGAQTAATLVGLQRVRARRHYASDVIAGAALGIVSTQISYWLAGKIFHSSASKRSLAYNDFRPGISVSSEAVYNLDDEIRTGFGLSFRGQLPFSCRWGGIISLRTASAIVKTDGIDSSPLNSYAAVAGMTGHFLLPAEWLAVEPSIQAGALVSESVRGYCGAACGFEADCEVALSWRLTSCFGVRGSVGYRLVTQPVPVSAVTVGLASVVLF